MRSNPHTAASSCNSLEAGLSWHPLELIPYFKRWPHSTARDLLYTFIWNSLIGCTLMSVGLMFSLPSNPWRYFYVNFVLTQTIGFTIHGLFDLSGMLLGSMLHKLPTWLRYLYFMLVPVLGVFLGYAIGLAVLDMDAARRYIFSAQGVRTILVFSLGMSAILCALFVARDRQVKAEMALAEQTQKALDAERRALEAQLRMLQAQIEPHFLYNTLANAVGLIAPAPDKARLLLERLIDYLRTSLSASREAETRLDHELETVRAYLDLMQVRMGQRLSYQLQCPPELGAIAIPPMLLQPLVENAIQHGLEPRIAGGTITLTVAQEDGTLLIEVADDGEGFNPAAKPRPGGGVGLANLRERLATLYGTAGGITLADQQPSGVRATLRLPLDGSPGKRGPQP